jgi:hypothetical protein
MASNLKSLFNLFFIKIKENGLWWSLKRAPVAVVSRIGFLRRFVARISWVLPMLRFMVRRTNSEEKRILAIWDFSKDPFTVGDFLVFQELSLVLREIHGVEKVDMIWLYSPDSFRVDGGLTKDNYYYYLSQRLPLAYVNPCLGSFMLMDSEKALESYIADNHHRFHIIPPYRDEKKNLVLNYTDYFNYIYKFYKQRGYIPYLSCNLSMLSWARLFIDEVTAQKIPVVVQLRNAKDSQNRNAKLDCWMKFFERCKDKYDVKFIIIGEKNQIDDRMRQMPNVVFSKDFGTTVEQDLALIQSCCLYFGTTSGPADMAMFSVLPYVVFNMQLVHTKLPHGSQHPFATPLQKMVWQPETTELLVAEFEELFSKIDIVQWKKDFESMIPEDRDKLSRHGVIPRVV